MAQDSKYIHKSHNVSVLLYHKVRSAKYRRVVFTKEVDKVLIETCNEIELRYEIHFLDIGADEDHVHFLVPYGVENFGAGDILSIRLANMVRRK